MTKYYITTPIYYSNGVPHIGHSYASLLADCLAEYHRLLGDEVRFSTGVDENSQKVVESAREKGMEIMDYADMMSAEHRAVWDGINVSYTDFVRTTDPHHHAYVQSVLQKSWENGDIYLGEYEGLYCVGCESFKKEKDLIDGHCPDHPNKEITFLREKNYFFRLSKYQDRLEEFFTKNPEFVVPEGRFREVIEFVRGGLEDFSISRETNQFGIQLPFDPTQVTYVWYDALFNYLSVVQDNEKKWWPADLHVIGKDIAKFHAIYWPAMLWSAGYEPPKQIIATGHFTVDGQKMSKTIGNVIDPVAYIREYGRDALILYLFTAFPIGEDGDFDQRQALLSYNAHLSNNLGNLLSRAITLALQIGGEIRKDAIDPIGETSLREYFASMDALDIRSAIELAFAYGSDLNRYIDDQKPWKIDTTTQEGIDQFSHVLYNTLYHLRRIALMLMPFFGEKMRELLARIGVPYDDQILLKSAFDIFPEYFVIKEKGTSLYPRIHVSE